MLVFDLETDGFISQCTTIHCISIHDTDTKETTTFSDQGHNEPVVRAVQHLETADCIAGHNVIGFDIPVIRKLFPWFNRDTGVADTLLLSRLYHPNLMEIDKKRKWRYMPLQLYGRHSLEAYGHRLGEFKGNFSKQTDWKEWSEEMEEYCVQDVNVTTKLCAHFANKMDG